MYRALTVFLALFLLSILAASVSAHVGDVTVETENFQGISGCPEAVTISWNGHTHPDSDPNRHDTLYYSAGYNAWGRGVGWASIPAAAAQAHTRKLDFPGGRGFTGQYDGRFGQQLRERLSGYPPPKHPPTWRVHITTGLTLIDIGWRMGRGAHSDREWENLRRDSGYRSESHNYWVRGLLSDDCLVRLFGVDRTQIPEWQPTPSPTSSPTPPVVSLPEPPAPTGLSMGSGIDTNFYNKLVIFFNFTWPDGIAAVRLEGNHPNLPSVIQRGYTKWTAAACLLNQGGQSLNFTITAYARGDGLKYKNQLSSSGQSFTQSVTCVGAATSPTPTPTTVCQFVLGFATLRDLIGHDIVGDCLENERYAANGNSEQRTTGGLLVWRKSDNWTAFTDGYRTWINGPNGLVQRLNTERFEWEADYAPGGGIATPALLARGRRDSVL